MYDKETKKCRGFGFITFDSPGPAEKVLALQHFSIAGKLVEVKSANPKVDRNKMNNQGPQQGGVPGILALKNPLKIFIFCLVYLTILT